jgi:hypothetical protein
MNRFVPFQERRGEQPREFDATFTLDQQVARARAEMGEARWLELQAEWGIEPPQVLRANRIGRDV